MFLTYLYKGEKTDRNSPTEHILLNMAKHMITGKQRQISFACWCPQACAGHTLLITRG